MTRINDQTPGSINLSQGFPDFDPPRPILDALAKAAYDGPHQYSVTFGAENFRNALAELYSRKLGRSVDPETEIAVTCGGTEAMMTAMMTICNPGDKVIIFSPFYENYGADAILSGAEPVFVPLVPPDFHFDPSVISPWQNFRACMTGPSPAVPCRRPTLLQDGGSTSGSRCHRTEIQTGIL